MAKTQRGPIHTEFKDAIVATPSQKGNWGSMGKPLAEGASETKGEISGVQFASIEGGEAGAKSYMKVSGKNPGPRG